MGQRKQISNEEFVSAWMNPANETIGDVAEYLQLKYASVTYRKQVLLDMGVQLPRKKRRSMTATERKLEVAKLNSLIKKLSKQ